MYHNNIKTINEKLSQHYTKQRKVESHMNKNVERNKEVRQA
jgi:hypothetical protein